MAISESQCDHFAQRHFRHVAKGAYKEKAEWVQVREEIRAWERERGKLNLDEM